MKTPWETLVPIIMGNLPNDVDGRLQALDALRAVLPEGQQRRDVNSVHLSLTNHLTLQRELSLGVPLVHPAPARGSARLGDKPLARGSARLSDKAIQR